MNQAPFETACDRVSQIVDAVQFERLRWAREEGPVIAKLVELAHAAVDQREDFELTEEGATADVKRFVLKVHSLRIIAIVLWLENGYACLRGEPIARSNYRLAAIEPVAIPIAQIDAAWMSAALERIFAGIAAG